MNNIADCVVGMMAYYNSPAVGCAHVFDMYEESRCIQCAQVLSELMQRTKNNVNFLFIAFFINIIFETTS